MSIPEQTKIQVSRLIYSNFLNSNSFSDEVGKFYLEQPFPKSNYYIIYALSSTHGRLKHDESHAKQCTDLSRHSISLLA